MYVVTGFLCSHIRIILSNFSLCIVHVLIGNVAWKWCVNFIVAIYPGLEIWCIANFRAEYVVAWKFRCLISQRGTCTCMSWHGNEKFNFSAAYVVDWKIKLIYQSAIILSNILILILRIRLAKICKSSDGQQWLTWKIHTPFSYHRLDLWYQSNRNWWMETWTLLTTCRLWSVG